MNKIKILGITILVALAIVKCKEKADVYAAGKIEEEVDNGLSYRPEFHFSPKKGWMNDPNGMVFFNGKYHLFYQHNPNGTTWGPMHWGHAISTDLIKWTHQPIALYPDHLGTIFSGSAVVDENNTAGFGKDALVAIFTHFDEKILEAKTGLHQFQSLAYSTDEGKTWVKYAGNPVLPNPEKVWDFRDPKVMWHEPSKQWVMTLATHPTTTFFGSKDLKVWNKLSEFGKELGSHDGAWECPDLFSLSVDGVQKWVLLVSVSAGAPAGGSGTQYFIGQFDGKTFTAEHKDTRWLDYGADNYAGVTWSNTGDRKIFLGWMNNWTYANATPEQGWRGSATIPRDLQLKNVDNQFYLSAYPVAELNANKGLVAKLNNIKVNKAYDLSAKIAPFKGKYELELTTAEKADFSLHISNAKGDELIIGYDKASNNFYTDRTKSGQVGFEKGFARKTFAPRIAKGNQISLKVLMDVTSAEVFADGGLSVMTNTFFPNATLNQLQIKGSSPFTIQEISYSGISVR